MNKLITLLLTLTISGLIMVGCSGKEEPADEVIGAEEIIKVTEAFGKVEPLVKENIILEFPARVTEIVANNGQKVIKGDVLFTLDMDQYMHDLEDKLQSLAIKELELANASTSLEAELTEYQRLESKYNDLKSKYDNGSSEHLIQLRNTIATNQSAWENAQAELENSVVLFDEGIISSSELKLMENSEARAKDDLDASNLDYTLMKQTLKDEIDSLNYSVQMSKTKVQGIELEEGISSAEYELTQLELSSLQNDYDQMFEKKYPIHI